MSFGGKFFLFFVLLLVAATGGYFYFQKNIADTDRQKTVKAGDVYLEFAGEIYDVIKANYWEKIPDDKLSGLYKLAAEKILNQPQNLETADKSGVKNLIAAIIKDYQPQKKKEFVAQLGDIVLANLQPLGRSRLYTAKLEKDLEENVKNIDSGADLYAALGVTKDASQKEIEQTYQKKSQELESDKSPAAQEKLAQISRAYEALAKPEKRQRYDQTGSEPTVISRLITPDIYYIKLTRFSPQSFDELQNAANAIDPEKSQGPTTLIFDLRANIGGSIDILQYFLGPFIGLDRYAYEFFHQGEKIPFKTKVGWLASLARYKKVVILTDDKMQSSAEVMTAALKKYNVGVAVGVPSKGWGTVERVFPMENQIDPNEKYSIFLAHSLTLRDDDQPIEGRGVDPAVNIEDKDWSQQLMAYFNYPELALVVKKLFGEGGTGNLGLPK